MSTVYTLNGKVLKNSSNDKWLAKKYVDPLNPIGLPDNTIRVKFNSGYTPTNIGDTQTLVDSTNNVWDIYKQSNDWTNLFKDNNNLLEVLGANTYNVTNMKSMFNNCTSLITTSLFDTSNVTTMQSMFEMPYPGNAALTLIPLFDTSNVTNMTGMFYNCNKVESGALALYQQASTQANPPSNHSNTFFHCGFDSSTGSDELRQIPRNWGGLGA